MHRLSSLTGLPVQQLRAILKFSFGATFLAAATVYLSIRLLFYEIVNPLSEELLNLVYTSLTSFLIGSVVAISIILLYCADKIRSSLRKINAPVNVPVKAAILTLVLLVIGAGSFAQVVKGTIKDKGTGLTAQYQSIVPGKALLVMNKEILNHTDIPLGESFMLVNQDTKGFVEKNGKVSVGCALLITDLSGKKLLEAPDLFKGKDLFDKKDMSYLKCTINTGAPMKWEEKYLVQVTFWDKYGRGRIVNKVTIRMIDIP